MEFRHNPPTLEQIRVNRGVEKNIRKEVNSTLSGSEKFALYMTKKIGSLGFFVFLLVWTIVWLGWNIWAPVHTRFDPAPAFVIWLFVSNILQLIFLPLILVGQNAESKVSEKRAEMDFEINKKAGHEVEVIIAHLENQNELILEIMKKVERR